MAKRETRLNQLEQAVKPGQECFVVHYCDWEPGHEPPPEKIKVSVQYFDGREPETMTLAEYKKRFPFWEENINVYVEFVDGSKENDLNLF